MQKHLLSSYFRFREPQQSGVVFQKKQMVQKKKKKNQKKHNNDPFYPLLSIFPFFLPWQMMISSYSIIPLTTLTIQLNSVLSIANAFTAVPFSSFAQVCVSYCMCPFMMAKCISMPVPDCRRCYCRRLKISHALQLDFYVRQQEILVTSLQA